ncbi:hypothetical protein K456DRAFT_59023 [Colletotrichum gloeosporioides 23]|nr:hypothetical protein K456DRAFT_59023 [Colletotrichum gloeosporioides 23]
MACRSHHRHTVRMSLPVCRTLSPDPVGFPRYANPHSAPSSHRHARPLGAEAEALLYGCCYFPLFLLVVLLTHTRTTLLQPRALTVSEIFNRDMFSRHPISAAISLVAPSGLHSSSAVTPWAVIHVVDPGSRLD